MTDKTPRSPEGFITLDEVLEGEGVRDAFQAVAIKEVLAYSRMIFDGIVKNLNPAIDSKV